MDTLQLHRVFTDEAGKTHIGEISRKGVVAQRGEASIVPPGCTRLLEGPALSMVIREFAPGFTSDYHTDPAQTHQLTVHIDGISEAKTRDGGKVRHEPGAITSVEDSVGEGHWSGDGGGDGFVVLFVARPANT